MTVLRPFYVDSPSTWDDQDGLDFSTDPDQLHDKLPQPFRLVNKIMESLLDDAWYRITQQQHQRDNEINRKHLPKLKGGVQVPLPYTVHHITTTPDNELLVGCGDGGLLAFSSDDVTRPLYRYNIDKEYLKVTTTCGSEAKTYIIVTLDSAGSISILGITTAGFIDMFLLTLEEGEKVLNISLNRINLAVSLADSEGKTSVAFYTLPLQAWSEPLGLISKNRLQGSPDDEISATFTKCDIFGRVRQPEAVQPCPKNQLSEALLPILNSLNNPIPLGQGLHHMLPASYFDNRRALLAKLPKYRDVDWETADKSVKLPHVVFIGMTKVLIWWTEHHVSTLHTVSSGKVSPWDQLQSKLTVQPDSIIPQSNSKTASSNLKPNLGLLANLAIKGKIADVENVDKTFLFCSNITSADSNSEFIGIGLESGLVSVIDIAEGLTLQTSLVSKSPVNQTRFVAKRLLVSCEDGSLAVLSCTVAGTCAMIQHISSENIQYHVTQILPLALYSNMAVVVLAPKRVVVVDVDSFRAVAVIPYGGTVSVCSTLNKHHVCLISLDTDCLTAKLQSIHPHSALYCRHAVTGDHCTPNQVMTVYDTSSDEQVTEHGYIDTPKVPLTADMLSAGFFNSRESEKGMRHQRLRERWYQYTEELESY